MRLWAPVARRRPFLGQPMTAGSAAVATGILQRFSVVHGHLLTAGTALALGVAVGSVLTFGPARLPASVFGGHTKCWIPVSRYRPFIGQPPNTRVAAVSPGLRVVSRPTLPTPPRSVFGQLPVYRLNPISPPLGLRVTPWRQIPQAAAVNAIVWGFPQGGGLGLGRGEVFEGDVSLVRRITGTVNVTRSASGDVSIVRQLTGDSEQ